MVCKQMWQLSLPTYPQKSSKRGYSNRRIISRPCDILNGFFDSLYNLTLIWGILIELTSQYLTKEQPKTKIFPVKLPVGGHPQSLNMVLPSLFKWIVSLWKYDDGEDVNKRMIRKVEKRNRIKWECRYRCRCCEKGCRRLRGNQRGEWWYFLGLAPEEDCWG